MIMFIFFYFQGNISDQGRLLMQGSFCVFTEHHRGRIKDLRFKPMHRHVFLYEKSILLCKKKEESPTGVDKGVYVFKNLLQVIFYQNFMQIYSILSNLDASLVSTFNQA